MCPSSEGHHKTPTSPRGTWTRLVLRMMARLNINPLKPYPQRLFWFFLETLDLTNLLRGSSRSSRFEMLYKAEFIFESMSRTSSICLCVKQRPCTFRFLFKCSFMLITKRSSNDLLTLKQKALELPLNIYISTIHHMCHQGLQTPANLSTVLITRIEMLGLEKSGPKKQRLNKLAWWRLVKKLLHENICFVNYYATIAVPFKT